MGITYVTAFLCGRTPKRSYDAYKGYFDRLAATGLPFVVFLDRRLDWTFPSNVFVLPVLLEETWVAQHVPSNAELPPIRNPVDTLEYMLIQASKLEWVERATYLNPWKTDWFAWIDFGIVHVFRDPDSTLNRLQRMGPPATREFRTAGIWAHKTADVWKQICWRFAGGFFLGDTESVRSVEAQFRETIERSLPKFTWEVNLWALMESNGVPMGWYIASHDDTIIDAGTIATISDGDSQTERSTP